MLQQIVKVVREAGEIMLNRKDLTLYGKEGFGNFVTDYDLRVQDYLISHLAKHFPNAAFVSEEGDFAQLEQVPPERFVIDPIDGTSNFICGFLMSAISVAYFYADEPLYAVIYNPFTAEMFTAEKDKGAFLNEQRIAIKERDFAQGIMEFGSAPYNRENRQRAFKLAQELSYQLMDVHSCGSAALALANVAANRNILYFDFELSPWDFAAGYLLISEAGGQCSQIDGSPMQFSNKQSILCGTDAAIKLFKSKYQG